MKPLSRAVDRLLHGLGIAGDVARVDALERWPAVAQEIFGADGATTRAVDVDASTLVVAVPTSAWAAEIRLRQRDIVAALERAAPRSGIRQVRTVPSAR
ncbi:MAG: DUF721 domain-containing protein [Chloroflexota bacterium]|nr:DUF721 domain-containing protein [Chloroflexota bacterium]MDE3194168.1 DUF721 domain-containing protein [Chloroflexota bacterium]